MNRRIFLKGLSGAVAAAVVPKIVAGDDRVHGVYRSIKQPYAMRFDGKTWVEGPKVDMGIYKTITVDMIDNKSPVTAEFINALNKKERL